MTPLFAPLLCLLLAAQDVTSQSSIELGFELLYTSNTEEFQNVSMNFTWNNLSWLNGTLVRVGPAQFEIGSNPNKSFVTHALDGLAKVATWNFQGNNSILFSTRFINSTYYNETQESKKFKSNIFHSPPVPGLNEQEALRCQDVGIDNMDISVEKFPDSRNDNDNYVTTNDISSVYEFSLEDLSTLRKATPDIPRAEGTVGEVSPQFLNHLSSSHPLPEPNTDNLINVVLQAELDSRRPLFFKVVRIKSMEQTEIIAQKEISEIRLLHSFSVTQSKVVILMNPFILNVSCMVNNQGHCYSYDNQNDSITVYVVDIHTGNIQNFTIPKIFVYHHINAYEVDAQKIVVDVAAYNSAVPLTKLSLRKIRDVLERKQIDPRADMKRINIDLASNTSTLVSIPSPNRNSEIASTLDFPVINEANRSRHYCYVYGIVEKLDNKNIGEMGIAKKDVCTDDGRNADAVYYRSGWYPSEPTFVPHPNATEEDDGILLVPYTSGADKVTHLVALNATDLAFIDIAGGATWIPQSQHGKYFDV